jgi:hypothetical protein
MKKCTLYLAAVCFSLTFIPVQSNAAAANTVAVAAVYSDSSERINAMLSRLNELKGINKADLTTADRKVLKKELRSMQKEMKKAGSNGVYISVGAAIIILLLLILIL